MNVVRIDSLGEPALTPYARLTEAQLRNRLHPGEGLFICESEKVIRVALAAGMVPVSFLCERKYIDTQVSVLARDFPDIPVYTAERHVLASLTGYELSRGVLCAMRRPPERGVGEVLGDTLLSQPQAAASSPSLGEQLDGNTNLVEQQDANFNSSPKLGEGDRPEAGGGVCRKRVAVLDGVVNSENTGAIFRAAAALGIDALLLTRTCCDPLNRRACRVSMGTVFQLPWTWLDHYGQLSELGFSTVALALTDRSVPIDHPSLKQHDRLAIILGTEGDGLADSVLQRCDHVARIPMQRGVDSLNVAAAAAVAFYELTR